MNRKELYDEIISLGLQEEARAKFNKNYTNCSNEELQSLVNNAHKHIKIMLCKKTFTQKKVNNTVDNKFIKLIEILSKKKILLSSEVAEIMTA